MVTERYHWLWMVIKLSMVTDGYGSVITGYGWLLSVVNGYGWLQMVMDGY